MTGDRVASVLDPRDDLRELVGVPVQRVADKVRARLHDLDRAFLVGPPFWLVATTDAAGRCDVSPKGEWQPDAVPSRAPIAHALERPDEPYGVVADHYGPSYGAHLYG